MILKELMTAAPAVAYPDELATQAAHTMKSEDVGFLPVVDKKTNKLLGVITDRDLCIRALASASELRKIQVKDCMSHKPVFCRANESVEQVLGLMDKYLVRRLPVVDPQTEKVIGVVAFGDIVRSGQPSAQEIARLYNKLTRPSAALHLAV